MLQFLAFSTWYAAYTAPMKFGDELYKQQLEMAEVYDMADSISVCEGYYKVGSLPNRRNNPGSLTGPNGLFQYPTRLEGRLALESLLYRRYRGMTIPQIGKRWATDPKWPYCVTSKLNPKTL